MRRRAGTWPPTSPDPEWCSLRSRKPRRSFYQPTGHTHTRTARWAGVGARPPAPAPAGETPSSLRCLPELVTFFLPLTQKEAKKITRTFLITQPTSDTPMSDYNQLQLLRELRDELRILRHLLSHLTQELDDDEEEEDN